MSDSLPLCRLILVILSCEVGWSLPSSILPCHELAGFEHYFQGERHIKQLHLHSSKTESTKWQALKCWDSFRQLPFLKFCSCSCCLLTELEEPNKYEHPSDKWALQNMDARADFCQHGKNTLLPKCFKMLCAGEQAKNSNRWQNVHHGQVDRD